MTEAKPLYGAAAVGGACAGQWAGATSCLCRTTDLHWLCLLLVAGTSMCGMKAGLPDPTLAPSTTGGRFWMPPRRRGAQVRAPTAGSVPAAAPERRKGSAVSDQMVKGMGGRGRLWDKVSQKPSAKRGPPSPRELSDQHTDKDDPGDTCGLPGRPPRESCDQEGCRPVLAASSPRIQASVSPRLGC